MVNDPVVKDYLLEQFDKLTVPLVEETDGSLSVEADPALLPRIQEVLNVGTIKSGLLES